MKAFRPVRQRTPTALTGLAIVAALVLALFAAGCGDPDTHGVDAAGSSGGLTAEQLEKGIGPVTHVELSAVDAALAEEGAALYKTKCSACHKLDQRYIGPELGAVLDRRTPEFVMNMMLNPEEMTQRHPVARALLAEYAAPMANQSLTVDQARAILEYIRASATDA